MTYFIRSIVVDTQNDLYVIQTLVS